MAVTGGLVGTKSGVARESKVLDVERWRIRVVSCTLDSNHKYAVNMEYILHFHGYERLRVDEAHRSSC